jgi:hypothetical protein
MAPDCSEYKNTSIYKFICLVTTQAAYTTHTLNNIHQYGKAEDNE